MKQNLIKFFILSAIFLFAVLLPASYAEDIAPEKKEVIDKMVVARVVWIKGTFTASQPDAAARELKTGSTIFLHDTLETAANTEAQIVFTDNSAMTFRPDTKFFIHDYSYDPKAKKGGGTVGRFVMDLIVGGFRTITGAIAKENPDEYQVNTPVATIGVRGTEFSVVFKDGKLYMKQYKGKPCIINNGAKKGQKADMKDAMCLNAAKRYAMVEDANSPPVELANVPDVFLVDVEVIPVTFLDPGAGGGPGGVTGFCIQ